jgi:hypothetical protein
MGRANDRWQIRDASTRKYSASYELSNKVAAKGGETLSYWKMTVESDGNIVHIKSKMLEQMRKNQ